MANQTLISLSADEALVLFELTSRFTESDKLEIEHAAEARVLWDLCAVLEKQLSEPFRKNYREILDAARENLVEDET